MKKKRDRVCPVELAGSLDMGIRRWVQNPLKILGPYIKEGMSVVDLGCGPGFFSVDMANLVGPTGRVIAVDLQEGMLQKLREKIRGTELEGRIALHRCGTDAIGVSDAVDFVLAFYMLHEVPGQERFLGEINSMLRAGGRLFVVEPPFHVSRAEFDTVVRRAEGAGLSVAERPRVLFSRAVVLEKS